MPGGACYFQMREDDVERVIAGFPEVQFVFSKTGTAEVTKKSPATGTFEKVADTSIFVGWGPAEIGTPANYAVSAIIPQAGFGADAAAPLAFSILRPASKGTLPPVGKPRMMCKSFRIKPSWTFQDPRNGRRRMAFAGHMEVIHVDEAKQQRDENGHPVVVARDAGLPGIIAHGLCTMAFTSWAVLTEVAGSDVSRLKRFAVRFSKMVLPGDDLETRIWAAGSADGTTSYAFETARVGTDEFAITDGLAVIAEEN